MFLVVYLHEIARSTYVDILKLVELVLLYMFGHDLKS